MSRKLARRKLFEVKNSGSEPVRLLVEHPLEPGWTLVAPAKPTEKTRDRYRFAVTAEPGKPATLAMAEERLVSQTVALTNLDEAAILFYSRAEFTSPALKQTLADVIERKREIERLAQERSRREQEIRVVDQEQERIRQNMAQLDRASDLYTRYVRKFAEQEGSARRLRSFRGRRRMPAAGSTNCSRSWRSNELGVGSQFREYANRKPTPDPCFPHLSADPKNGPDTFSAFFPQSAPARVTRAS